MLVTWHIKLKEELAGMNFTPSEADPAFFIYRADDIVTYMIVYVDDILVAAKTVALIEKFKKDFLSRFDARDIGDP